MKLKVTEAFKLFYYSRIIKLMKEIGNYYLGNDVNEMIEYWEEVYKNKITFLIKDKLEKL